jgi:hypothetical protein
LVLPDISQMRRAESVRLLEASATINIGRARPTDAG